MSIEKWRTIILTNPLLKPVVAKNPEGVEVFLKKIGFSADEKPNAFKFCKVESGDKSKASIFGNTNTLKVVLESLSAAQEGKPILPEPEVKVPEVKVPEVKEPEVKEPN